MSKYVKFLISCSNSSLKFLAFIFCFLHLFLAYTYIYSYLTSVWGLAGPCLILFSYERNRILSQLPLALYNIIVLNCTTFIAPRGICPYCNKYISLAYCTTLACAACYAKASSTASGSSFLMQHFIPQPPQ
jgi:hypothetical protein